MDIDASIACLFQNDEEMHETPQMGAAELGAALENIVPADWIGISKPSDLHVFPLSYHRLAVCASFVACLGAFQSVLLTPKAFFFFHFSAISFSPSSKD